MGGVGGLAPLVLLVMSLKSATNWLVHERPAAVVFIKDPERPALGLSLSLFSEHFGLTPAQAALAGKLPPRVARAGCFGLHRSRFRTVC
jgi:hypothetical protein